MKKHAHHDYFDQAYRTGSDVWTHIPYMKTALSMMPNDISDDAMILDVGAGRGIWALKLVRLGYRVLGIDTVPGIVKKANEDIKIEGFEGKARFVEGDVLDIPFTDGSFGMTTDIGLLQHLPKEEWSEYITEVARVTASQGYYLNVSLSKETSDFMGWFPKTDEQSDYEKFDVKYHFFTKDEIKQVFKSHFTVKKQMVRYFDSKTDPEDSVALVFSLMQKK